MVSGAEGEVVRLVVLWEVAMTSEAGDETIAPAVVVPDCPWVIVWWDSVPFEPLNTVPAGTASVFADGLGHAVDEVAQEEEKDIAEGSLAPPDDPGASCCPEVEKAP